MREERKKVLPAARTAEKKEKREGKEGRTQPVGAQKNGQITDMVEAAERIIRGEDTAPFSVCTLRKRTHFFTPFLLGCFFSALLCAACACIWIF